MYNIALCEDDEIFSNAQEKICREILNKLKIEYRIDIFKNGEKFFADFAENQKQYNLILLDIVMDGMNGMELARKIRGCDSEVTIIFVTSSIDYALQGYDVNALHYLIKPLNSSVLEQLISADYRKKFQNDFLCFKSGTKSLRISFGDIIRVETTGRRVTITLQDEDVYYPGKLSELLEELPQREFVRCHQAFAINLRNTKELTRQSAIAANGVETPISRTYAKDTQKAFLRYIRDN